MKNDEKSQRKEIMQGLSFAAHIGITIASCIMIGVLLGRFLDSLLSTSPWMLLIFSVLGVAAAIREIMRGGGEL